MREFLRGPLARVSYELDTAYYGTVAYNRRVMLEWTLAVVFAGLRQIGIIQYGPATPTPEEDERTLAHPRPKLENTYHWINKLHHIGMDVVGLPDFEPRPGWFSAHTMLDATEEAHAARLAVSELAGWESYAAWRMDVLLGLVGLPPSRLRAFTLYMGGRDRTEIAKLMPADGGEPWDDNSVRSALKESSGQIRRRSELHWPAKGAPRITSPIPTSEIGEIEAAIAKIRRQVSK